MSPLENCVKLAVYVVKGVSCSEVMRYFKGMLKTGKDFLIPTLTEYALASLEIEFKDSTDRCKFAYVKVSLPGSRMWREVFRVCCEESDHAVLALRRVRGVGRIGADAVGHRLLEIIKTERGAQNIEVLKSEFF